MFGGQSALAFFSSACALLISPSALFLFLPRASPATGRDRCQSLPAGAQGARQPAPPFRETRQAAAGTCPGRSAAPAIPSRRARCCASVPDRIETVSRCALPLYVRRAEDADP